MHEPTIEATGAFVARMNASAAERAGGSGQDLVSSMSDIERFGGIVVQLAVAGTETTRAASSFAMQLLAEHPEQLATIAGVDESEGEWVYLSLATANRDDAVASAPTSAWAPR